MCKKRNDVGKIYKTTDGYFTQNKKITKPRRVAVLDQRKDDGALAVCKIYSKKDKSGKAYIEKVVLYPEEHNSLTEPSIVGSQVIIGTRGKDGQYRAILKRDLEQTDDKLTAKEKKVIKANMGGPTKKNKRTTKKKLQKWKKHFKK